MAELVRRFSSFRSETWTALSIFAATALLIMLMKMLNPSFGSLSQLYAIGTTAIFLVVASFGQGIVILSGRGGLDLSIGVVMSVGAMTVSHITVGSNDNLWWAVPVTLLVGAFIGAFNGVGVTRLKIPPFVMTLASASIFYGIALGLTYGGMQQPVAPALVSLMAADIGGIPAPIFLMVAFVLIGVYIHRGTAFGRNVYAIGNSERAAVIAGVRVTRITIMVYTLSGLTAALAGILLAGYSSAATLLIGNPYLLPTIAAVVIGGGRISGGKGLYLGTFAGALFLSVVVTAITMLSLEQAYRNIIEGGIIVAALLLQAKDWGGVFRRTTQLSK